jgi:hypothetical protein
LNEKEVARKVKNFEEYQRIDRRGNRMFAFCWENEREDGESLTSVE